MQIDPFMVVVQFSLLLLSLSVHESAHAYTADRLGDPTARYLGRVSLNPIVHADLFGTIIFPIIGLFSGLMFGWAKPVPVNVGRLRNPVRDHMLVAAAGPGSNLLIALGLFGLLMIALVKGDNLVIWSTNIYNYALGFSCWHAIAVNCTLLPRELRPGWARRILLAAAGSFFMIIAVLTTLNQLKLLG